MAKTLSAGPFRVSGSFTHTNTTTLGSTVNYSDSVAWTGTFTDGSGASQANKIYAEKLTITGGASNNLDLAGGVTDPFGASFSFALFKILYVELTTESAATALQVGGHATLAVNTLFTSVTNHDTDQPGIKIVNGGCFFVGRTDATGYVVTATTEDILLLKNLDGAVSAIVKIVIVGA
jgi:hypothetical protein